MTGAVGSVDRGKLFPLGRVVPSGQAALRKRDGPWRVERDDRCTCQGWKAEEVDGEHG